MTVTVERLDTGDYMVWGAQDHDSARDALLDDEEFSDEVYVRRTKEFPDVDVEVVLTGFDVNLFRKNPCHPRMCDEGHGYHLGWARSKGHGARAGVLVGDFMLVPVEYEVDIPAISREPV